MMTSNDQLWLKQNCDAQLNKERIHYNRMLCSECIADSTDWECRYHSEFGKQPPAAAHECLGREKSFLRTDRIT